MATENKSDSGAVVPSDVRGAGCDLNVEGLGRRKIYRDVSMRKKRTLLIKELPDTSK